MSVDNDFAEILSRIEHKLDVLMMLAAHLVVANPKGEDLLHKINKLNQVGSTNHACFLCGKLAQYVVDPINSIILRKCGCKTGKIALDMKTFATPMATNIKETEINYGDQNTDNTAPRNKSRNR